MLFKEASNVDDFTKTIGYPSIEDILSRICIDVVKSSMSSHIYTHRYLSKYIYIKVDDLAL